MELFLLDLVKDHTLLSSILMGMGLLRAVFKPIMSALQSYVKETPSESDDKKLNAILESKVFKVFAWFLDYAASIKVPKK